MTEKRNIPLLCQKQKYIKPYCIDEPSVFVSFDIEALLEKSEYVTVQEGVFVTPMAYEDGFNEEYFSASIVGKRVYVPLWERGDFLPTNVRYFLVNSTEDIVLPREEFYKEVIVDGEGTIAELYKNAWRYRYVMKMDAFIPLSDGDALQNLTRPFLESDIEIVAGNAMDRISDYGRILLFLIDKALPSMSAEERALFGDLAPFVPKQEKLRSIIKREVEVQDLVARHKNDPLERITFNG